MSQVDANTASAAESNRKKVATGSRSKTTVAVEPRKKLRLLESCHKAEATKKSNRITQKNSRKTSGLNVVKLSEFSKNSLDQEERSRGNAYSRVRGGVSTQRLLKGANSVSVPSPSNSDPVNSSSHSLSRDAHRYAKKNNTCLNRNSPQLKEGSHAENGEFANCSQQVIVIEEAKPSAKIPKQVTVLKEDGGEETAVVIEPSMLEEVQNQHEDMAAITRQQRVHQDIVAASYNIATAVNETYAPSASGHGRVEVEESVSDDEDDEAGKEYTQMNGVTSLQQTVDSNEVQQQQQQHQGYVDYAGQSVFQQQQPMNAAWFPNEQPLVNTPLISGGANMHYPQASMHQSSNTSGLRYAQYGVETVPYQSSMQSANYGRSQEGYVPQYTLGPNGQYYRSMQPSDGLKYDIIDASSNLVMAQPSSAVPGYRASSVSGYRVMSPGSAAMQSGSSYPAMMGSECDRTWDDVESGEDEINDAKRDKRTKKKKVKRPMNAFMVWARQKRTIYAKKNPGLTNAEISIRLGERWHALKPLEKQPYFDQAEKIKAEHKKAHPDWTYQPRPKRRRMGQGSTMLWAITENPRGGQSCRYINTYVHPNSDLRFPATDSGAMAAAMPPNSIPGMVTVPIQHGQAAAHPHAMYINQSLPTGSMRVPTHMMSSSLAQRQLSGAHVIMQNQGSQPLLLGNAMSGQPHMQVVNGQAILSQQQASMMSQQASMIPQQSSQLGGMTDTSVHQHTTEASNKARTASQNLAMTNRMIVSGYALQQPIANVVPTSGNMSQRVSKATTMDMADDARRILDMTNLAKNREEKNRSSELKMSADISKPILAGYNDSSLPSLQEFLQPGVARRAPVGAETTASASMNGSSSCTSRPQ